jgi:hypothetical protein
MTLRTVAFKATPIDQFDLKNDDLMQDINRIPQPGKGPPP